MSTAPNGPSAGTNVFSTGVLPDAVARSVIHSEHENSLIVSDCRRSDGGGI